MFVCREKSHSPFIRVYINMPLSGMSLKDGFQLLRIQNTVDAVIVNEKTNASVFEHLVYKYDLFAQLLSLYTITENIFNNCILHLLMMLILWCDISTTC